MSEKILNVEAKSRRNRASLTFISKNATQPVLEALNKGKVSIFYAEQIAHLPAESQPAELKRIQETIKRGKPLTDDKTVSRY
jgi:hypothetical protein